jgi:HEAT repeat protein
MLMDFRELLRRLSDSQIAFSIAMLYCLSGMDGAKVRLFREAWPTISLERRRRIITSLVEIAEASFEVDFNAVFRFCLKDEDEKVRGMAIEGLWEDEDVSLIDPLINMMREDPSIQVRAKAATSLGRFVLLGELREIDTEKAAVVSEALLGVILSPNEDVEVRRRAVESIAYLSDERVREIIEAAYYDDDERMRVSAVFAMGRSADPLWSSIVLKELESPYPEMRYEAARACGELEISDAVPILANLVEDQDREVQEAAIWALGNIGGNEARRILESCYITGDDFLREAVEEALDQLELLSASFNIPFHELESDVYEDADPYLL